MSRQAGIDEPGALYRIVARGIGRDKIFRDDLARDAWLAERKDERIASGEVLGLPGLLNVKR